jgi:hypothetical protein
MKIWKKPRPSLQLLSAQEDDTHRGDKEKHTDDLKREVIALEKGKADAGHIIE